MERIFDKLQQQHCFAARYDKSVLIFERFLILAGASLWPKSFVNTASRKYLPSLG